MQHGFGLDFSQQYARVGAAGNVRVGMKFPVSLERDLGAGGHVKDVRRLPVQPIGALAGRFATQKPRNAIRPLNAWSYFPYELHVLRMRRIIWPPPAPSAIPSNGRDAEGPGIRNRADVRNPEPHRAVQTNRPVVEHVTDLDRVEKGRSRDTALIELVDSQLHTDLRKTAIVLDRAFRLTCCPEKGVAPGRGRRSADVQRVVSQRWNEELSQHARASRLRRTLFLVGARRRNQLRCKESRAIVVGHDGEGVSRSVRRDQFFVERSHQTLFRAEPQCELVVALRQLRCSDDRNPPAALYVVAALSARPDDQVTRDVFNGSMVPRFTPVDHPDARRIRGVRTHIRGRSLGLGARLGRNASRTALVL